MPSGELMVLPVTRFTTGGNVYGGRDGNRRPAPHELYALLDLDAFTRQATADTDDAWREEIAAVTERARRAKSDLGREVESFKNELRQIENAFSRTGAASPSGLTPRKSGRRPAGASNPASSRCSWTG